MAQFNLGALYYDGHGVPQDYAAAVDWYRKAAEQGLAQAQGGLGVMYATGKGVAQDYVFAHMWFNLAAASGQKDSVKIRDVLAARMTPAQISEAQKLAREWKPTSALH
jgi:TPR repeat protein